MLTAESGLEVGGAAGALEIADSNSVMVISSGAFEGGEFGEAPLKHHTLIIIGGIIKRHHFLVGFLTYFWNLVGRAVISRSIGWAFVWKLCFVLKKRRRGTVLKT